MTYEPERHGVRSSLEDNRDPAYPFLASLDEVRAFLDGTGAVTFTAPVAEERYRWLEADLRRFRYDTLKRADKGRLQAYLRKVTGYSRAQLTRLVGPWLGTADHRPARPAGATVCASPYRRRRKGSGNAGWPAPPAPATVRTGHQEAGRAGCHGLRRPHHIHDAPQVIARQRVWHLRSLPT